MVLKFLDDAWEASWATSTFFGNVRDHVPLDQKGKHAASTVSKIASVAVFPQMISKSISYVSDLYQCLKGEARSVTSMAFDGLSLVGKGCDCVTTTNTLLNAGKSLPVVGSLSDGITVITDGKELVSHIGKVGKNYQKMENAKTEKARSYYSGKRWIECVRVAKAIFSVAMAAIALLALAFAFVSTYAIVLVPISALYLGATLGDVFGSKCLAK